jgi:urease accessory protein
VITLPPPRVGRDGSLGLRFERRGPTTVLAACRGTVPLQVLAPLPLETGAAVVSVLNPTGGLCGGDRLTIDVDVGPGAHACLTTPSATKVYRTHGAPACQDVTLRLAADAVVEWVPDHAIPFAGSAVVQTVRVALGAGARLVCVDAWASGRVARGEAWSFTLLDSTLVVQDDAGLLLHDRLRLAGPAAWDGLGLAEGHPYFATVLVVGDGLDGFDAAVADALGPAAEAAVGVAPLRRRGALARCLAPSAPALTEAIDRIWTVARRRLLGAPRLALRKF